MKTLITILTLTLSIIAQGDVAQKSKEIIQKDDNIVNLRHQGFNRLGEFSIGQEKLIITGLNDKLKVILTRGAVQAGTSYNSISDDWFVYVFEFGDMWLYNEGGYTVYHIDNNKVTAIDEEFFQKKNIKVPVEVSNYKKRTNRAIQPPTKRRS